MYPHSSNGQVRADSDRLLYRGVKDGVTWKRWCSFRATSEAVQTVEFLALVVSESLPRIKGPAGRLQLEEVMSSPAVLKMRQSFARLPDSLRPRRIPSELDCVQLSLRLEGELLRLARN